MDTFHNEKVGPLWPNERNELEKREFLAANRKFGTCAQSVYTTNRIDPIHLNLNGFLCAAGRNSLVQKEPAVCLATHTHTHTDTRLIAAGANVHGVMVCSPSNNIPHVTHRAVVVDSFEAVCRALSSTLAKSTVKFGSQFWN